MTETELDKAVNDIVESANRNPAMSSSVPQETSIRFLNGIIEELTVARDLIKSEMDDDDGSDWDLEDGL